MTRRRVEARKTFEAKLEELVPKALRVLEQNLDSEDERVRQRAAETVLDRAWGKPSQEVRAEVSTAPDPLLLRVFRDGSEPTKVRMQAADWLADRGYGRPATVIDAEIRQDDSDAYRKAHRDFLRALTDEQLAYLIELGRDAEPEGGSGGGPVAALPETT